MKVTYNGVDLSGERLSLAVTPDPYIARIADAERTKGRVYVQKVCNEWRREVGMPSRQVEVARETSVRLKASVAADREVMAKVAAVFNPGAPDGRNNWEDLPAVGATPIFDAVEREMGAPL